MVLLKKIINKIRGKKNNAITTVLFDDNNKSRALVSLMLHDLQASTNLSHTIYAETKAFCEALFELGYNVDLINFGFE